MFALNQMVSTLLGVKDDRSGSIAVFFGIALLVVCGTSGMAIDLGLAHQRKSSAQAKIDAAVLAAIRTDGEAAARTAFASFLEAGGLDPTKSDFSWAQVGGQFRANASYSGQSPTSLMKLMGSDAIPFSVAAEATTPVKISSFSIEIEEAFGWSDKNIAFWVERTDGSQEVVARLTYTMTSTTGAGGRGTGTTVVTPSNTVIVENLSSMWIEMQVTKYDGSTYSYVTKDASVSSRIFIDGRQLQPGESSVASLLPCEKSSRYAVEDTNNPEGAMQWDEQDLFFTVETTCAIPDGAMVLLTK